MRKSLVYAVYLSVEALWTDIPALYNYIYIYVWILYKGQSFFLAYFEVKQEKKFIASVVTFFLT